MIGSWFRRRRARIAAHRAAISHNEAKAKRATQDLEAVRRQWPAVRERSEWTRQEIRVNHIGDAVEAMIHHRRTK